MYEDDEGTLPVIHCWTADDPSETFLRIARYALECNVPLHLLTETSRNTRVDWCVTGANEAGIYGYDLGVYVASLLRIDTSTPRYMFVPRMQIRVMAVMTTACTSKHERVASERQDTLLEQIINEQLGLLTS